MSKALIDLMVGLATHLTKPKIAHRRVLILEDDADATERLCQICRSEGFEPDPFVSQQDAERHMSKGQWAMGVFDIRIPGGCGHSAQRSFVRQFPTTPALVLSGSEDAILKIIQGGSIITAVWKGSDFRPMEDATRQMLQRIKQNGNGKHVSMPEMLLYLTFLLLSNALVAWLVWKLCGAGILKTHP